jgi:uncharacterized membrane protein
VVEVGAALLGEIDERTLTRRAPAGRRAPGGTRPYRQDVGDWTGTRRWRGRAPLLVALAFTVSGVVHLTHPSTFTGIVPTFLPAPTAWVEVSGVAELVCAAGLWRRAAWAGWAAAALLLVIWPANLQMAVTAQEGRDRLEQVADWVRLPLQLPLIWCAMQRPRRVT